MQKVIIIGGGFGGLNAAKTLKNASVNVLVIDKANHHLFQPLLYQVATAALSPGDIAYPIREILSKQDNTAVLMAEIVGIDKEQKYVIAANGERYPYDYLILSPGSRHSYFSHPEWEKSAPGLKTLNDALNIRERIILSYERAEWCKDPEEALKYMRFIVVGGGPTGVEMAGAIAEIASKSLVRNFRHIKPEQTKVYLIEAASQILPTFPKDLADKAKAELENLGVEVLLDSFVTDINDQGVFIREKFIESHCILWAAGNAVSPLLKSLNIPLDKSGRAIVNPDLSIPGHPEVFIIGDAALTDDKTGQPLPGIAPVAIQQGQYVAKLIKNQTPEGKRKKFAYFDKGMMATIGKEKAIVMIGKVHFAGYFAWIIWCYVHIAYLIGFPHKMLVMLEWFYLYLFNQRRLRLITRPINEKKRYD